MDSIDEEFKKDFTPIEYTDRKSKDDLLDDNFKKAEKSKKPKKEGKKQVKKKPFLLSGLAIIIVAIICISILTFLPWMYIKYESASTENSTVEINYYKDFINNKDINHEEVTSFFQSENGSYFTGLSYNDFSSTPKVMTYGFIAFILLGAIFTLFAIINRKKELSSEKIIIIHSIFAVITIIIATFLIFSSLKFLTSHFLIHYNMNFIKQIFPNPVLIFPAPNILIFILAGVIKLGFSILKINYREIQQIIDDERPKKSLYTYIPGDKKI